MNLIYIHFSSFGFLQYPTSSSYTLKNLIAGGAHAQLYSNNFIKKYILQYENSKNKYFDWNIDGYVYKIKNYNYRYPLILQKINCNTENSSVWGNQFMYFIFENILQLNTNPLLGFYIIQSINNSVYQLIIIFGILFIFIKIKLI